MTVRFFIYILLSILILPAMAQDIFIERNALGMEFVKIKAGTMTVGRIELVCPEPPTEEENSGEGKWKTEDYEHCRELAHLHSRPGFEVVMEADYLIGRYEVTQDQWEKVMGFNPSHFTVDRVGKDTGRFPVESVTWQDVQLFITKLNELDSTAKYRLPSEFEWEYAARAGAKSPLSWSQTKKEAWIQATNFGSPQEVGLMQPNDWGIFDMLGNVWEWVDDFYNMDIVPGPVPPSSGNHHVIKGGSFTSDVVNATYFFHGAGPGNGFDVGFRLIMEAR